MSNEFIPYGFQSGLFVGDDSPTSSSTLQSELHNDDSYAGSMYYDAQHNVLYFTGSTYGVYFDSATNLSSAVKEEMGMSGVEEDGRDMNDPHLDTSDCFLGVLKLPPPGSSESRPELIFARRFGTPRNLETCSSIIMLPNVNDALLQTTAQVKLALLGHVNPTPLTSTEVAAIDGGERRLDLMTNRNRVLQQSEEMNMGGLLHSLLDDGPITDIGRAYSFVADFDLSLTLDEKYTASLSSATSFNNAYGALLGGTVLDSSPLVYGVAITQNKRDPNQLYVVSMHSDDESELNPEYTADYALEQEIDGVLRERSDMTMGGAGLGSTAMKLAKGGVPKYGTNFYVKVQQLTVIPYEELMDVEPTVDEKVKQTMNIGWGFGFKLNDANDVRPSTVVFIKGRTPDEDVLLLGGTTRKDGEDGKLDELDGFITKLIPPAPTPVDDLTTGSDLESAIQNENIHPTKRLDSTTGRDETVTAICVPPPDPLSGLVTHVYVVGSSVTGHGSSLAYIVKLRLDDLSITWKEHVPSIHLSQGGGDVLGEGCAVSPDGSTVFLSGTIDGGSVLDKRIMSNNSDDIDPVGGTSDVFVVALDADFGHVSWARQLGTVNEDKLARGGGIECDNEGNVIIMGSSRGGLQRHRPDETSPRIPSDIFIMNLSGADGRYINAPFISGVDGSPVSASTPSDSPVINLSEKRLPAGAIAGISVSVVIISAILFLGICRRRSSRKRSSGGMLRSWQNNGDDFTFDNSGNKRGNHNLRIVRGLHDDDWDDGSESVSRNATWMSQGGSRRDPYNDAGSITSTGSKRSTKSNHSEFLASLREEKNSTTKKMGSLSDGINLTSDPRLDGGVSIKTLLSHYREVKKETLFDDDDSSRASERHGELDDNNEDRPMIHRKKPPPPPPPRKKASSDSANSGNGLSEFTII